MNKKRKETIENSELSEIKTYTLGGYPQKVLIDGKYKKNPMLIFLHGGPGSPMPFCAGCRGMFPEITSRFTLVEWDQLGCGINDCKLENSFKIEDFVNMTVDLIKAIKRDFPENSVNLFGVSWGSLLAAKAAEKAPELIGGVLIYSQIVKGLAFNEEVYTALKNSNMPNKQKLRLESIFKEKEHSKKDQRAVAMWIYKYTDGYSAKKGGKMPIGDILKGILTSPDYSLKNFKSAVINGAMKNESLYNELMNIDLTKTLENIAVPYYIIQGSCDIVASTKTVSEIVENSENKNLKLKIIENNGHMPGPQGINFILNEGLNTLNQKTEELKK